jgi:hypothetical protein
MISVGEVTQAIHSRGAYYVNMYDGTEQLCRLGNVGVKVPLTEGDQVLCVISDTPVSSGWIILCRLDEKKIPLVGPLALDKDRTKSKEQRYAEEQEDLISKAVGGYAIDGVPDWGEGEGDPPVYGEILAKSRTSNAFQKVLSDGSIINFVDEILHLVLAKYGSAAILRAKQIICDVVPGFGFKVVPQKDIQLPNVPDKAQKVEKTKTRLETWLSSDSDNDLLDFFLEAGLLFDKDDPGYGKSVDTKGQKIKRGLRLRIGDFAIFEIDNENNEIRLTSEPPGATPDDLYQIRWTVGQEFVISWGKQFISFRDDGILLKGTLLGFAGPWAMWSKTVTDLLRHNTELDRDQMKPVCEWKEDGTGIKFNKSVYFGDNEELAVLQSFIDTVYSTDKEALKVHFHTYAPPAVVTGTAPALQAILEATDALLIDPVISNVLSDVIQL